MANLPQTFSESWYRVAAQRVALRPHVQMRLQYFRGDKWYVLQDPFSNQFFRLRPAAYEFVSRLHRNRTIQEVWEQCMTMFPDDAPGQEEVIRLLAQLYQFNLLQYENSQDSRQLFERFSKRRQREVRSQLLGIMFARFPLLDPDAFLVRTMPLVRLLISPFGAVLWLAVTIFAGKQILEHWDAARTQAEGVLAPGNLLLLYAGMIVLKVCHEFGHAYFCRRFGGEVHTMGVMLLVFTPIPYMDATSAWAFRNRWQRVLVSAAGMIVEVFVAALAAIVWAKTGEGLLHSLAYNMMVVASVATVIFNINPLLRFDGYYILSDLVDIPNLYGQSGKQMLHFVEYYLFGCSDSTGVGGTWSETAFLYVFFVASRIYRVLVFGGILLIVADMFLLFGLIMLVICAISWVLVPVVRLIRYLAASPKLRRNRPRAIAVVSALVIATVSILQFVHWPDRFRAPGIVEVGHYVAVVNDAPGFVDEVLAPPGSRVRTGQPLLHLVDPELPLELRRAQAQLTEAEARRRRSMQLEPADMAPLAERIAAIHAHLAQLAEREASLTVRARLDGLWAAPKIDEYRGAWLSRGTPLGLVIDDSGQRFRAVVNQQEAARLFNSELRDLQVRFPGQAATVLEVGDYEVIPADLATLPSPALGWAAGGNVAVDLQDPSGRRTAEPFFEVRAMIAANDAVRLWHGQSGQMRFELPPKPILTQLVRRLRQLLQQRYQI